jgi:hypothetical protein
MAKIIDGFKTFNLIAIVLIMAAAVVAGCAGTKAPQSQLDFSAKAASGLIITNNGGDTITLKNEIITVKREVNDKVVDGLNAVPLYGNTPEFQDAPVIKTMERGQKIRHVWKEPLSLGDVLVITIQDAPSGNFVVNTKVTVT